MVTTMNFLSILVVVLLTTSFAHADEKPLRDVKGMKCPVDATSKCEGGYCSKKVKRDIFVKHDGRNVYFCCKGCVKDFTKDPKAFLAKVKEQWAVIDEKNK